MNEEDRYEEFSNRMEEKYPYMFSYPYGGFAVGEGWWHIIEKLCSQIDAHVKWKRNTRAYQLRLDRARDKGRDAVLKFICRGTHVRDWDEERADDIMKTPHAITPYVHRVQVHQIKEKFGGLRFYYQGGDDVVDGMVRMAEIWAGDSCEQCGERGERRDGGWIQTLCDKHEAERQERYAKMRSEDE